MEEILTGNSLVYLLKLIFVMARVDKKIPFVYLHR